MGIKFLGGNDLKIDWLQIMELFVIRLLFFIRMGVCIGTCSKVDKNAPEINPNDKKQIEKNLSPAPFEGDDCNLKTAENDNFYPKEQQVPSNQAAPGQPQPAPNNQENKEGQDEAEGTPNTAAPIEPENYRNRKIQQGITNLLKRGKTQKDNEQIESTLSCQQMMKLGPIELDNGITYEGQWKDAMREGVGTQTWADNSKYVGEWKLNKANGKDGDIYEGEWLNDKANGKGTYTHSNGAKYVGDWKDDKQNGVGIEEWLDGQRYEGEYKNGTKTGKGVLKFLDGSYYEGQFLNNEIHGQGIYVWCKNRKYEGEWQNNKMHGNGKTEWTDGRKYEGQYVNDKKHGIGAFYWSDGRKYHGAWKEGKQHGRGEYYLTSGEKKVGEWVEGKRIKWIDEGTPKETKGV